MRRYDVLIIGSGAAGQTVAAECAKAGKTVTVIDRLPFGGTCALRGCQPKKVLLAAVEAISRVDGLGGSGVSGSSTVDWPALMRRKRDYIDATPEKTLSWMKAMGIVTLSGTARFTSPETVDVDGESIHATSIVVAAGARPIELGFAGQELVKTSTDFLSLERMPAEVAFIGGGYISFEFARLAQLAGAKVTIVHRSSQVLKGFDPNLADMLANRYRALGIDLVLDSPVERVERTASGRIAAVTAGAAIEVDGAFHGAGRMPDLDDLDLDVAGVDYTHRGVTVDASLRSTSNPRVWSAGDAAAIGAPLTPVAGAQGEVVAAGILGRRAIFDDSSTPSVVFSDPPLARVGVDTAEVAADERLEVRAFDMSSWFTQTRVGNTASGARLVIDRESDTIKGAHLLGVEVEEIINVFALAIRFGITVEDLKAVIWSYPTLAYDINYLTGRY